MRQEDGQLANAMRMPWAYTQVRGRPRCMTAQGEAHSAV